MENELGAFIKYKRGNKSLREFADLIGISHSHLDSIEKGYDPKTGKPVNISVEVLSKLAKILDVSDIVMLYLHKGYVKEYLKKYDKVIEELKGIDNNLLDHLKDNNKVVEKFFSNDNKINIGEMQLKKLIIDNFSDDDIIALAKNYNFFKNCNENEIKYFIDNVLRKEINNDLWFDNAKIIDINNEIIKIPVFGTIKAGIPIESQPNIIDYIDIPKNWTKGNKKFYGLKISGDSMSPKYLDGDIVIFEQNDDKELFNGKDVAIMINGTESTFKKIIVNKDGIILQPYNTIYNVIMFTKEQVEKLPIRVIGIAKEKRTKID